MEKILKCMAEPETVFTGIDTVSPQKVATKFNGEFFLECFRGTNRSKGGLPIGLEDRDRT